MPPEGVVDALQASVRLHLLAVETYQAQGEHFSRWGYPKLGEKYRADAEEERGHLRDLLKRLEFYDVQSTYEHAQPDWPRHDFEGVLASNLTLESTAAEAEKANIFACRAVGDELSALVFVDLLEGSEASVAEIEATQLVVQQIGLDNYLASQV
jgi:bacterioferritin (cytochrome b1)